MRKILVTIAAMIAATAVSLSLMPTAASAAAAGHPCTTAWKSPSSELAHVCRELGWTIHGRIVVTPHGVATFSRLPKCDPDAAWLRPCGVNLTRAAAGPSSWIDGNGRVHYVWTHAPRCTTGVWCWPTETDRHNFHLASATVQIHRTAQHRAAFVRFPSGAVYLIDCRPAGACTRYQVH